MTSIDRTQRTSQPTAYRTLMDDALKPEIAHVSDALRHAHDQALQGLPDVLATALRTAYSQGLVHGFQQGVEAECKARDASIADGGERFDAPGCQMCGAPEGEPCDCHDPQGGEQHG